MLLRKAKSLRGSISYLYLSWDRINTYWVGVYVLKSKLLTILIISDIYNREYSSRMFPENGWISSVYRI